MICKEKNRWTKAVHHHRAELVDARVLGENTKSAKRSQCHTIKPMSHYIGYADFSERREINEPGGRHRRRAMYSEHAKTAKRSQCQTVWIMRICQRGAKPTNLAPVVGDGRPAPTTRKPPNEANVTLCGLCGPAREARKQRVWRPSSGSGGPLRTSENCETKPILAGPSRFGLNARTAPCPGFMKSRSFHAYAFIPILWRGSPLPCKGVVRGSVCTSQGRDLQLFRFLFARSRSDKPVHPPFAQDLVTYRAGTTPPDPSGLPLPSSPPIGEERFARGGKTRNEIAMNAQPVQDQLLIAPASTFQNHATRLRQRICVSFAHPDPAKTIHWERCRS
jgi:hypothetical protein